MQEAQGSIYGEVITQSCMLHGIATKKKKKKKPKQNNNTDMQPNVRTIRQGI